MKIIKYLKKDWPMIPIVIFLMAGYFCPFFDFIPLPVEQAGVENPEFHPLWKLMGVVLLLVGGFIEIKVRFVLIDKANFSGFNSTKILQIIKDHRLITDGMFKYVRHPLYIGRTLISFGWVLLFSSLPGVLLMAIGVLFFLPRIRIEEDMLLKEFGNAYRDYQKTTKKLIPYLY